MLVDDDRTFAADCVHALLGRGLDATYCASAEQAREHLLSHPVDIALIDLMLPPDYNREGVELLRHVLAKYPETRAVMITVREKGTTELVAEAMKLGARNFLDKNSNVFKDRLLLSIEEVLMEDRQHVFVSHGQNELLKLKLKDFLTNRLGRRVVVLSELPSHGLTVVEKLERASQQCSCAIILMTRDDETKDGGLRARQNVVHEIGFFQGRYGRRNVILLAERGVELFSNISGIVRIEFDAGAFEGAFEPLRVELAAAPGATPGP